MSLSPDLIAAFAKIIANNDKPTATEKVVYGTVVDKNNTFYVQLDGSDLLTPISNTVEVKDGERVTVMLKNHAAVVTGNLSSPAVRTETVQILVSNVANIEDVLLELETVSPAAFAQAVERLDTLEDVVCDIDIELDTITESVGTNTTEITSLKELVATLQSEIEALKG